MRLAVVCALLLPLLGCQSQSHMGPGSTPPVPTGGPIYHGNPGAPVDNRQNAQPHPVITTVPSRRYSHSPPSRRYTHSPKSVPYKKPVKDVDTHEGGSGGGGGSRSDIRLKRDIVELDQLKNGIHLYRFRYNWSDQQYVGVIAQEVRRVVPGAVSTGADGYLRVDYSKLGLRLETWDEWVREHPQTASTPN